MSVARQLAKRILPLPIRVALRRTKMWLRAERSISSLILRYCTGSGIEVGAGRNPYCKRSKVLFIDKSLGTAQGTPDPDITADAAQIPLPDRSVDFVFSSHCLEHHQDTIRVLNEWLRLLKPGGTLFLILPHAERTLDRHRARTTLVHHLHDFETLGAEPDRSHFDEMEDGWRKLEDLGHWEELSRQAWDVDFWDWEFRLANDALHFHVWTQDDIIRLLQHLGLEILVAEERLPEREDSFAVIARSSPVHPPRPARQTESAGGVRESESADGDCNRHAFS